MSTRSTSDIAIVGMSCLFPGASSLQKYWENICGRVDAVCDPPDDWGFNGDYDPEATTNDKFYCKRGGHLGDLAEFTPTKYGVMPNAIDGADPEQFLALRVAHETFADAGYMDRPFDRKKTGVILGRGSFPNRGLGAGLQHALIVEQTLKILKQLHPEYSADDLAALKAELKAEIPPFNSDTIQGTVSNIMSGRIANRLDLQGPNYGVDAACAASTLAIDQGMRELASGRCDMILAGGVSVFCSGALNLVFCQLNALSQSSQIRPFDQRADGTLLGSGVGMVLLKRLEDAERDDDRIYAVVKGVGIASDGRAMGMLAPRYEGEELAIRRAYEDSEIDPSTIRLIEAHGTGTPIGDPTEIRALAGVFGERKKDHASIALGSVKSMISHLIPAAGIAGVIKAALSVYHKVLPPTIHCEQPNPELELEKTPFYLNTETRPWIHGEPHPRRAGVNAFGFGGINTHTIIEEYREPADANAPNMNHVWDAEVFVLQAASREELVTEAQKLQIFLSKNADVSCKDIAFTLNCTKPPAASRIAIVADSVQDLSQKLTHVIERLQDKSTTQIQDRSGIFFFEKPFAPVGKLAFLFPGEGSQYPNLLADLCLHFPEVRECFDQGNQVWGNAWRELLPGDVLFPPPKPDPADDPDIDERIWNLDVATAAVYMADYAMFKLLRKLKIEPDLMAGHSSGELTALFSSGAVDADDDETVIQYCLDLLQTGDKVSDRVPEAALVTVGISDSDIVFEYVAKQDNDLEIAIDNCPHQLILCGSKEEILKAKDDLQNEGAICTLLPFERAYHTEQYQPVSDEFFDLFKQWEIKSPDIPVISCATAEPYPDDPDDIRRWAADQWARSVRFRETIDSLYEKGVRLFVEVGPRANLTGFVGDTLQDRSHLAMPSNVHFRSGISQLMHLLGILAAHGVSMDLNHLYSRRCPETVDFERDGESEEEKRARSLTVVLPTELPRMQVTHPEKYHSSVKGESPPQALSASDLQSPVPVIEEQGTPKIESPVRVAQEPETQTTTPEPKTAVVTAHLKTMEQFLQTQQEVYAAYFKKSDGPESGE